MIITSIFFILSLSEPIEVVALDREYNRIKCHNDHIYCAPFIGRSIFQLTESRDIRSISFTDDINYRIYDFYMTPFAIYLNNGKSIEKFYFAQGVKETIYSSRDIVSFIITPAEEVIFADREKHELVFLDFTNNVKLKELDIKIKDLQRVDNLIYVLTNNSLILFDEYGNTIGKKAIPEKCNRILVDSATIFLFSRNKKHFYKLNGDVQKIECAHGISDMCIDNKLIVILDGSGTHLYIYNKSQIK